MTRKDLIEMLADVPDDMEILVPLNPNNGFDGIFFTPCMVESQIVGLGTQDISKEEFERAQNLGLPLTDIKSFVLVPCGFYREHDTSHELN